MEDKHVHSSMKILKNTGNDTESNIGIVALVEIIEESNNVTKNMFEELSNIRKSVDGLKVDESIERNNEILLLKINKQTEKTANNIVGRIKEKLESINKYLLLKIALGTLVIAFVISYLFGHYNTDKIEAIESTLKTIIESKN